MAKSAEIKTNKWNGLTNYQCPYCPHASTAGKEVIEAHILGTHSSQLRQSELEKMTADVAENPAGLGTVPDKEKK